jgi:hypothetical protein
MNVLMNGTPADWLRYAFVSFAQGVHKVGRPPFTNTMRRRMPPTPPSNVSSGTAEPTEPSKYSILPLAPEDEFQVKNVPVGNVVSKLLPPLSHGPSPVE